MRKLFNFLLLPCLALTVRADSLSDIPAPQKRAATVEFAKSVLVSGSPVVATVDGGALKNPFNPVDPAPVSASSSNAAEAAPVQNERTRLEQIAPKVTPSGSVEVGGEAYLLFGQKRLKVGDHLSIIFEGNPYELELSGIQSTSFTLRLNGVEITRSIKSVNKP